MIKKRKILIINTGGTFSASKTKKGLKPKLIKKDLLEKLKPVSNDSIITFNDLFSIDSANITPEHWKKIADLIGSIYKKYDGIVIIHGTDTLSYTGAMLSHMLSGIPIPVVLTGSQLSIMNPVADALENMRAAIYMANSGYQGIYVAFDRKIMLAKCVSKTHSKDFNAFESINCDNVATINAFGMNINEDLIPKKSKNFKVHSNYSKEVFLLKLFPGLQANIISKLVECGIRGIVIESYGLGGLPFLYDDFITECKKAIRSGVKIVILSQCTYDGVNLSVYETGRKTKAIGVIVADKETKEYAITRLMWELGNK